MKKDMGIRHENENRIVMKLFNSLWHLLMLTAKELQSKILLESCLHILGNLTKLFTHICLAILNGSQLAFG